MTDMRGAASVRAWLMPSVVAALVAVFLVGAADGCLGTGRLELTLVAAGFFGVVAAPLALAAALIVRGLWRAWAVGELAAATTDATGAAPRLAAWSFYAQAALSALAGSAFGAVHQLQRATSARPVIELGTALVVAGVAVGVLVLSRPLVRSGAAALGRLERAVQRRRGRPLLTPRAVVSASLVLWAVELAAAWRWWIRPRIGPLDMSLAGHAAAMLVILLGLHAAWPWVSSRRGLARGLVALALAAAAVMVLAAAHGRYLRSYALITVWGDTRLAGSAIDLVYDVQALRSEIRMREFRPARHSGAEPPDIVVITIDSLRADRTALHGGKVMPVLAGLGREGTVFEWAFSPSNVTRRSLPSMMTGLHPTRVHGRVTGWALRLDPRHVLVAERLRAAGYDTAGFFCCASLFDPDNRIGWVRGIDHVVLHRQGAVLVDEARRWLAERDGSQARRPVFMWLHFYEPHSWQDDFPAKRYGASPPGRYDHSLTAVDMILADLLQVVWTEERKPRTLLAISSDHGQGLGDHGHLTHSTSLYNSEIRVPFVLVGPGVARQRVTQPVGLVSLAPTLLELAGFVPPAAPQMDGASLAPLVRGQRSDDLDAGEAYSVMVQDRSVPASAHALIRGRYKYIWSPASGRAELYDIVADPGEARDLLASDEAADVVTRMRARLDELHAASAEVSH